MSDQNRHGPSRLLECPRDTEYDEETFRYFLALEQARAERSNHSLHLLLASVEPVPGQPAAFPPSGATDVFNGLRMSLRDTDVRGWYRQGRVAGAVLHVPAGSAGSETSGRLEQRIGDAVRRRLPSHLAQCLRVRVVQQLGPRQMEHERRTT